MNRSSVPEVDPAPEDDERLRYGLGVVLGALFVLLPMLIGRMDVETLLLVSAIGAIVILPVWRDVGGPLNTPRGLIGFLQLVIGPIIIARVFSGPAIWTYVGAWLCTLGVMRLATGWRDRS